MTWAPNLRHRSRKRGPKWFRVRTLAAWSIGLTDEVNQGEAYLHDGRAQFLEEAILWHGGEGGRIP